MGAVDRPRGPVSLGPKAFASAQALPLADWSMATTIAEAARRWGVDGETIYRRQLAGELNFATTDPPTVEACEMVRVFGEPKPKPDKAAAVGDTCAVARVEAFCNMLKAEVRRLKAELASIKQELRDTRDDARRERDLLLDLLAALVESHVRKPLSVLQRGETGEALAVLAAQQRRESHNSSALERSDPECDQEALAVLAAQQRLKSRPSSALERSDPERDQRDDL
jgi:uncharacterized small protein (DUF1192 family)